MKKKGRGFILSSLPLSLPNPLLRKDPYAKEIGASIQGVLEKLEPFPLAPSLPEQRRGD